MLFVQGVICCILMAAIILPAQYRDPLSMIASYPPQVIRRVESLPQYRDKILQREKAHLEKKAGGLILLVVVLAAVAYLSGCRGYGAAFRHVFILMLAVNLFDLLVLDWGVFCHSKRLRIPGTEDMDEAYGDRLFHLRGAAVGMVLGTLVAALAAGIVCLIA